jgi:succinate dehydrogenase/fumarate reductase-like Fe-S protein
MANGGKKITVECFRLDPDMDPQPSFQKYEVPFVRDSSVLDVLEYIYENIDPSLAFYASCRRGICGRCNIRVNGKARLSCGELVTGDLKLEPTRPKKVVRDLKVEDI